MEWKISTELVDYEEAIQEMEARLPLIAEGKADELVWLLEHPPLYSCGSSAKDSDLLDKTRFPIYYSGRGGQVTYHGPGQRIGYIMLNLKQRKPDLHHYIWCLEEWLRLTLEEFGITALRREGRVGLWVERSDGRDDKIAAFGVRVKKWVTYHGFALNVSPDLTHYQGIIPCGIQEHGVTSLQQLGVDVSLEEVDQVLEKVFPQIFV